MDEPRSGLQACDEPLVTHYDLAMLDLDGVVYVGADAVPGAPALLSAARAQGMTLAFVTNNAARPPSAVAHHLQELGVDAHESDVVTSAQAAARVVSERVPQGARVLVVGGEGLILALRELGLVPVSSSDDDPVAVVQGFHPSVGWPLLAEAAYAVRKGLPWVASNLDLSVPTARGIAPGNGALVNAVASATGRRPDAVAGKPYRPLFDETIRRINATRPLMVGDRLDTDIEGATNCGADSLLVMTGVTDLRALCQAPPRRRPSYVASTLDGLLSAHERPAFHDGQWHLGGWSAEVVDGRVDIGGRGVDEDDGLRVLATACWAWTDAHHDEALDADTLTAALGVPGSSRR